MSNTVYYYDRSTGELIGTTNEVKAKYRVSQNTIYRYRRPIEGTGNFTLDLAKFLAERPPEIKITEIVNSDGEIIAHSVRQLADLLEIDYNAAYRRVHEIPDGPPHRRMYKNFDAKEGDDDPMGLNWRYRIYDQMGNYMTDDVELLVKMTGIPLDLIYNHLKERVKGRDDQWTFYPYEID